MASVHENEVTLPLCELQNDLKSLNSCGLWSYFSKETNFLLKCLRDRPLLYFFPTLVISHIAELKSFSENDAAVNSGEVTIFPLHSYTATDAVSVRGYVGLPEFIFTSSYTKASQFNLD